MRINNKMIDKLKNNPNFENIGIYQCIEDCYRKKEDILVSKKGTYSIVYKEFNNLGSYIMCKHNVGTVRIRESELNNYFCNIAQLRKEKINKLMKNSF